MRQHGNVTRRQLRELGISDQGVKHRVAIGRLFRVRRGVYAVGRPPVVPLEHAAAAVLACGRHAALSHGAALTLWGVQERWPRRFDVTATAGDPRPPGIVVHRHRLHRRDLTRQRGIPVTAPARTLLDCAPELDDAGLARAVNDARLAGLVSPGALGEVIARYPRHPGSKRLAPFAHTTGAPTESRFEDRFSALCTRYGLPAPAFGVWVAGHRVDALFAPERLIVECDGWEFHRDHRTFVADRARDADTLAAGCATLRITWETPDEQIAARIAAILAQRRYTL